MNEITYWRVPEGETRIAILRGNRRVAFHYMMPGYSSLVCPAESASETPRPCAICEEWRQLEQCRHELAFDVKPRVRYLFPIVDPVEPEKVQVWSCPIRLAKDIISGHDHIISRDGYGLETRWEILPLSDKRDELELLEQPDLDAIPVASARDIGLALTAWRLEQATALGTTEAMDESGMIHMMEVGA